MARPNKGANYLGPFLGIVYEPEKETTKVAKGNTLPKNHFQKYWFTEFTLGVGGKTLNRGLATEHNLKLHKDIPIIVGSSLLSTEPILSILTYSIVMHVAGHLA